MAVHRIFERPMVKSARLDDETTYLFKDGRLRVDWRRRAFVKGCDDTAAAFYVKTRRSSPPVVSPLRPPQTDSGLVAWLGGFAKHQRAESPAEYDKIVLRELEKRPWMACEEVIRPDWKYMLGSDQSGRKHFIAIYINKSAKKSDWVELLSDLWENVSMRYPQEYARSLLESRLAFTEKEIKAIGLVG